jgi:hypothetical protein
VSKSNHYYFDMQEGFDKRVSGGTMNYKKTAEMCYSIDRQQLFY